MEEATAVPLPDDVLRKIFLGVKDLVALFRCATACKRWCSLLGADPSFLRRCLPEDAGRSSPFSGFFAQQRRPRGLPKPCFVLGPQPVFGGLLDCPRLPGCADSGVPLTCRGGLLLVRLGDLPIVCNPLTGRFKSLPPLKHNCGSSANYSTGYAILTAADCSSSNSEDGEGGELPFFKVLIMTIQKDAMQYRLHTLSSAGDGEWGWSTCSGRVDHDMCAPLCQQNAVVCGGAARWFFCNKWGLYSFDVGTKTGDVSMAKLLTVKPRDPLRPKAYDEPYLSLDAEGRLTLFSLQLDGNQVDIWTWHEDGRCIPTLLKLDPPSRKKKKNKTKAGRGVEYACLGEKNGTLLIKDDQQRVYAVSVKTGVMQEVADCPRGGVGRREIVPLEIDWPALFVSRLGELAME